MAAELDRIKRNVGKMIDGGASEGEIQLYLKTEGVTPGQLRASKFITDEAMKAGTKPREAEVPKGAIDIRMEGSRSTPEAITRGVLDMSTFGFGDEIAAGALSALPGRSYEQELEKQRAYGKADAENRPLARFAGQLGGAVAAPIGGAATAATRLGRMAQGAGYGAAFGGAYGFGSGEGGFANRAGEAVEGGALGGLAGGALAGILPRSGAAAGQANPNAGAIAAAERQGIPVPRVAASGPSTQNIGRKISDLPWVGSPLREAAENTVEATKSRLDDVVAGYGGPQSRLTAGGALERGMAVAKDKADDTLRTLYDDLGNTINPNATAPLQATRSVVDDIVKTSEAARLPPGPVANMLRQAVDDPQGLTFEGAKALRTRIGEMLKQPNALESQGISQAQLSRVYGALSDDLKTVVGTAGGAPATKAFEKANNTARNLLSRNNKLAKWIGRAEGESVAAKFIAAAKSGGRENAQMLALGRKVLGKDAWDKLSAATVNELGVSARTGQWSPDVFLSSYGKLTKQGRAILFGSTGKDNLAKALDDLAEVSRLTRSMEQFANKSQSGNVVAIGAGGFGMATAPWMTIMSALGGRIAAQVLAKPVTVRALTDWQRAYNTAIAKPTQASVRAVNNNAARAGVVISNALGLPKATNLNELVAKMARGDDEPRDEVIPRPRNQ